MSVVSAHQRVAGWGVELAIKKTEYTVLDDSGIEGDSEHDFRHHLKTKHWCPYFLN